MEKKQAYKSQKKQQMKMKKICTYDKWSTGAIYERQTKSKNKQKFQTLSGDIDICGSQKRWIANTLFIEFLWSNADEV